MQIRVTATGNEDFDEALVRGEGARVWDGVSGGEGEGGPVGVDDGGALGGRK